MGYRIAKTVCRGLVVPPEDVAAFAAEAARAAEDAYEAKFVDPEGTEECLDVRRARSKIAIHPSTAKRVVLLREFLRDVVKGPFLVSSRGDGSVEVEYDEIAWDGVWDEGAVLAMVGVLAKHVRRNAFLGFVGEDSDLWSYVFDGTGGYRPAKPTIDWLGLSEEEGERL